jgi:hypothetical protein
LEIFNHRYPDDIYVVDTLRYYNATGDISCGLQPLMTTRITHNRHIMDLSSGQAWEQFEDSIWNHTSLPRHVVSGTGLIQLNSRLVFTVDSYGVTTVRPPDESEVLVTEAHLRMSWKDGYTFDLEISKTTPYKAMDFFPASGGGAAGDKVMTGKIRNDTTTVGYIDLFADRSVMIRDWTGKPVKAE